MRFVKSSLLNRELSVLGFGSAAVLGRVGRRDSLAALGAALDVGINVFDTARSYGYGESESLLGEFFQGHRHQVIISSKFGILPVKQSFWKQAAKPLARVAVRMIPTLAKRVRSQVAAQFHPGQFTVQTLNASVSASLQMLRTDYLDILFMHEASMSAVADQDLLRAMEDLVKAGKVRLIGVSAEPEIVLSALETQSVKAVQFACHISNGFAQLLAESRMAEHVLRFANHPFGGVQGAAAIQAKFKALGAEGQLPPVLQANAAPADRALLADLILNNALLGNDVVLATMMSPAHLRTNAAALSQSRFDLNEIKELRRWLIQSDLPLHEQRQEKVG